MWQARAGEAMSYERTGDDSRGSGPRFSKLSVPVRWDARCQRRRGFNLGDGGEGDLVPYEKVRGGEEQAGA